LDEDGGKNFEINGKIFETHDHLSTAQTSGVKTSIQATQPIANARAVETTVEEDRNGSCSITFGVVFTV
jgi:hypothetical protein